MANHIDGGGGGDLGGGGGDDVVGRFFVSGMEAEGVLEVQLFSVGVGDEFDAGTACAPFGEGACECGAAARVRIG